MQYYKYNIYDNQYKILQLISSTTVDGYHGQEGREMGSMQAWRGSVSALTTTERHVLLELACIFTWSKSSNYIYIKEGFDCTLKKKNVFKKSFSKHFYI